MNPELIRFLMQLLGGREMFPPQSRIGAPWPTFQQHDLAPWEQQRVYLMQWMRPLLTQMLQGALQPQATPWQMQPMAPTPAMAPIQQVQQPAAVQQPAMAQQALRGTRRTPWESPYAEPPTRPPAPGMVWEGVQTPNPMLPWQGWVGYGPGGMKYVATGRQRKYSPSVQRVLQGGY